jgi:peptidyl-prolyl cis-trans isomerase C
MIQEVTRLMKVLSVRVLVCVVVCLLFLTGCRDEKVGKGDAEKRDSNVLALIGDEEITKEDLEAAMEQIPEKKRTALRNRVLDSLIEARVFAEEAKKAGFTEDPEVQKALERMTDETLARYFIKTHIDKEAEPSEEEVRKYYEEHKDQFVVPDGVMIQEIVVKTREEAQKVLKALKGGASFEDLAKKESIAPSWKKEGHEGWLFKGKMDPELEKVAFDLEKGKLSDIIKTEKGYYQVVKVLDKSEERQIPFEEARLRIRIRLFGKRKNELVHEFYKAAKVDTNPAEQGVLVKIGEEAIPEDYLVPILGKVPTDEKLRQRWITYLVETKVFSKEARKVHLENDPEVVLELKRKTEGILAKTFRTRVMNKKLQVSDKDIADYYEAHPDKFEVPPRVRAKSILVKTRQEAEEILEQLKSGGNYALLAIEKSLYPDAATRGGTIGWFGKGERDPALEAAAFSLEKGQISGIIETKAGYEIIKLMDKKGGGTRPLDEVKDAIGMQLRMQRFEQEKQRYYEQAGVKILGA